MAAESFFELVEPSVGDMLFSANGYFTLFCV